MGSIEIGTGRSKSPVSVDGEAWMSKAEVLEMLRKVNPPIFSLNLNHEYVEGYLDGMEYLAQGIAKALEEK